MDEETNLENELLSFQELSERFTVGRGRQNISDVFGSQNLRAYGTTYKTPNKYRRFNHDKVDIVRGKLIVSLLNRMARPELLDDTDALKKYLCRYAQLDGYTALKTTDELFTEACGDLLCGHSGARLEVETHKDEEHWAPVFYVKTNNPLSVPTKDGGYDYVNANNKYPVDIMAGISMNLRHSTDKHSGVAEAARGLATRGTRVFKGRYLSIGDNGEVRDFDRDMFGMLAVLLSRNLFLPYLVRVFDEVVMSSKRSDRYMSQINHDVHNGLSGKRIFQLDNRTVCDLKQALGSEVPSDDNDIKSILDNISGRVRQDCYGVFLKSLKKQFKLELELRAAPKTTKPKKKPLRPLVAFGGGVTSVPESVWRTEPFTFTDMIATNQF